MFDTMNKSEIKEIKNNLLKSPTYAYTNSQEKAIKKIIKFLLSDQNIFGLYGYAGTGKTTTITEIVYNLLKNRYIKSVILTASTHKATNVIKNKFSDKLKMLSDIFINNNQEDKNNQEKDIFILNKLYTQDIKIDFTTIHKLLHFKSEFTNDGEMVFIRSDGVTDYNIDDYELIIIDECSMLSTSLLSEIIKEAKNNRKIILCGDSCQLPPVNETTSALFNDVITLNEYKKNMNINSDDIIIQEEYNKFINIIKNIKSTTLKQIVRSSFNDVIGICTEIRDWIIKNKSFPDMSKYNLDNHVYFFENNNNKINSDWFNKFIEQTKKGKDLNIILQWTNKQADIYNKEVRKRLFNKKIINKYEIGDIIVFNDFYAYNDKFHTSQQVRIVSINKINLQIKLFDLELSKSAQQIKSISCQDKYSAILDYINKQIQKEFRCFKLGVVNLDRTNNTENIKTVYVLDDNEYENHQHIKEYISNMIRKLREDFLKNNIGLILVDKYIIQPLWREYHENIINPFANITYGYSMTIHKAQGSNFYNVYVDVDDILSNKREIEMKKCLYTAVTRTVNELNILI